MEQYHPRTELVGPDARGGQEEGEGAVGVSPESGISSASPLSSPSLHPEDSSPVLQPRPPQVDTVLSSPSIHMEYNGSRT
ncbi:MAG: hypothetical protein ACK56I_06600, partial [bacterium]